MTTTAKIKAKGCSATGLTEDIATRLYNTKGTRILAIVELKSDKTHESADGDRQVDLSIETIEPVIDGDLNGALDEHVRNIQAALFRNRKLSEGDDEQLDFDDDGPAPKVADIIAQGQPFVVDEDELAAQEAAEQAEDDSSEDPDAEPDAHDPATASTIGSPFTVVPG